MWKSIFTFLIFKGLQDILCWVNSSGVLIDENYFRKRKYSSSLLNKIIHKKMTFKYDIDCMIFICWKWIELCPVYEFTLLYSAPVIENSNKYKRTMTLVLPGDMNFSDWCTDLNHFLPCVNCVSCSTYTSFLWSSLQWSWLYLMTAVCVSYGLNS